MTSTFFDDCCLRKRNIFSIVTVTVSHRLQQCTCTIDGGHRLYIVLYDIIKQHNYAHICAQTKQYTKKWYGCVRVAIKMDMDDALSATDAQYFRSPCRIIQRSYYRKHTQVPLSQYELWRNTANKVRFIALLASHLKAAGCEVQHASADGDRLISLMALGFADTGGASVLVGHDKTFS